MRSSRNLHLALCWIPLNYMIIPHEMVMWQKIIVKGRKVVAGVPIEYWLLYTYFHGLFHPPYPRWFSLPMIFTLSILSLLTLFLKFLPIAVSRAFSLECPVTAHKWQKWKSIFLTCHCHNNCMEEEVGLIISNYTFKNMILWVCEI